MRLRGWLYLVARLMGDATAIRKGCVDRRVGRRLAGRLLSRRLW